MAAVCPGLDEFERVHSGELEGSSRLRWTMLVDLPCCFAALWHQIRLQRRGRRTVALSQLMKPLRLHDSPALGKANRPYRYASLTPTVC